MSKTDNEQLDFQNISQAELKEFYRLQRAATDAMARYHAIAFKMSRRLTGGAQQEPGTYHLEKKQWRRRYVAWKQVVIELKGEKYANEVLDKQKPKTYTWLEFGDIGSKLHGKDK